MKSVRFVEFWDLSQIEYTEEIHETLEKLDFYVSTKNLFGKKYYTIMKQGKGTKYSVLLGVDEAYFYAFIHGCSVTLKEKEKK